MTVRGGFGGGGFGGNGPNTSMLQNYRFSEAVESAAGTSSPIAVVGGVTGGQQFMVLRDSICTGVDVTWATSGAPSTLSLEWWDSGGSIIASGSCAVTSVPTRQTVNWATPIDLAEDGLLGQMLVISAFQASADEYYWDTAAALVNVAGPVVVGPGVVSYGSIYSVGHVFPATNTALGTFGLDANLRAK